jgi:hypothetical protein
MNARSFGAIGLAVLIGAAVSCGSSSSNTPATSGTTAAADATTPVSEASTTSTVADRPIQTGATRMHFEIGPITIKPGQNNIAFTRGKIPKPDVDGYIVRIKPDLRLADGSIPGVDVIHLHHGVWLNSSARDATSALPERFFAAGEEKTTMALPVGYGYSYKATDKWTFNYMIHNLWPDEQQVWVTYDLDFIPATSPAAAGIEPARPIWTDVQNGSVYPVFDVLKGSGQNGLYTYPDDATAPYGANPAKNAWTVDRDGVLLATAGHLHPGGLHTDLWLQRAGTTALADHAKAGATDTAHLFVSSANYYEPAGAVSWDVSMTATLKDWRVAVHKGDVMTTTATYDSSRASWYESMGIMIVWMADKLNAADTLAAADPFTTAVDGAGELTHGHLKENDNHGGGIDTKYKYADASTLASQPAASPIDISDFIYAQGDMLRADPIPTVQAGGTITYNNVDAPLGNGEWHTITACKAPCTGATGIAYPLADADISFDSGQLGDAGPPTAGRVTWSTPADLPPGTYTYFCRIHPVMRGAFRISAATP